MSGDEEVALLAAAHTLPRGAGPRLQALIVAALETGCRRGELLSLQWRDVDLERRELRIRDAQGTDANARSVPISARLASVLETAWAKASGRRRTPEAYVFDTRSKAVGSVKWAWESAVLKAHGHEPEWVGSALSADSLAHLRSIDLHFHDLRHEAGARWLEAGWPRHHVRTMLGHAGGSDTDTYQNAARMGLHAFMRRFDETRSKPPARSEPPEPRSAAGEQVEPLQKDARR